MFRRQFAIVENPPRPPGALLYPADLTCLNARGEPVATMEGDSFAGPRGGGVLFVMPSMARIRMRGVYFEETGRITVPIRLETGVGF